MILQAHTEPETAAGVVLALLPRVGGDVVLEEAGVTPLDRRGARFFGAAKDVELRIIFSV